MSQIIRNWITPEGNHMLEIKPLKKPKVSESGQTVQVAGTLGFSEALEGTFHKTEDGELVQLRAVVQIRHRRKNETTRT